MGNVQPGILLPPPALARYMIFSLRPDTQPIQPLKELAASVDGEQSVIGLGESLLNVLGIEVAGVKTFPVYSGTAVDVPSTPAALWCWLRGRRE